MNLPLLSNFLIDLKPKGLLLSFSVSSSWNPYSSSSSSSAPPAAPAPAAEGCRRSRRVPRRWLPARRPWPAGGPPVPPPRPAAAEGLPACPGSGFRSP